MSVMRIICIVLASLLAVAGAIMLTVTYICSFFKTRRKEELAIAIVVFAFSIVAIWPNEVEPILWCVLGALLAYRMVDNGLPAQGYLCLALCGAHSFLRAFLTYFLADYGFFNSDLFNVLSLSRVFVRVAAIALAVWGEFCIQRKNCSQ